MEFWGNKIQANINDELKSQKCNLLVNLASKEYFSVLGKMPEDINAGDVVIPSKGRQGKPPEHQPHQSNEF